MIHISATELKERMQREELFLLDVREPSEHNEFNIGGELLPLDTLMASAERIPPDRPVIVYCKKGIRSQIAIQRLQEKFGFANLINLQGGMDAWKKLTG
jgi:rhodanese-related sulfurtransferase